MTRIRAEGSLTLIAPERLLNTCGLFNYDQELKPPTLVLSHKCLGEKAKKLFFGIFVKFIGNYEHN